jgi:hypothetical protein
MNSFEEEARATLRARENTLDGTTLARLGAARRAALATPAAPWWRLHVPALGGAALAVAVAVAVLMPMQEQLRAPTRAGEPVVEDPQFYEDLDFYMWLAESEMGSHG